MKKKMTCLLLTAVLLLGCLSGCGKGAGESAATTKPGETGAPATQGQTEQKNGESKDAQDQGEIVNIVWQCPFAGEFGEGFYRMEDALNEMMEKDIGVHVTFERTDLGTSTTDATLMLSAGEQLDIIFSLGSNIKNAIDSGLVIPIDDLCETYGQDIIEQSGSLMDTYVVDGKLYGMSVVGPLHMDFGYNMKKEYAEKYNCMPEDGKIYSLKELEAIFETIREGEGKDTIMFVPWNNTYEPLNYNLCAYDKLGGDLSWGVLMLEGESRDPEKIVNLFETEEYAEFCRTMYDWAQKGYISADAAVTSDLPDDICKRDNVVGTFAYGAPDPRLKQMPSWSKEVVVFNTVAPFRAGGTAGALWQITSSCENPEKAMEALNYLFKNKKAAWLIQYGFEGEEYEIVETDGDNALARWLSDTPGELPYYNVYGLWGNMLDLPVFEPQDILNNQIRREIGENLPADRVSPAVGYSFDSTSVTSDLAAIQTVIAQYAPTLNAGAIDPEKALPEFIEALKAAEIDKVIAENQRQYDEFLNAK